MKFCSGLAPKRSVGVNLSTENDRSKSTKEFDFRRKHRVVVTKRVPRKVGRKVKPENESTKFPLSVSMKRVAKTILSELPRYRPEPIIM